MDKTKFEKYVLLYGANVETWPHEIKDISENINQKSSEIQNILQEHSDFESFLKLRTCAPPSKDLSSKIVASALTERNKKKSSIFFDLMSEFNFTNKSIVLAFALIIIILFAGFIIGFSNPLDETINSINLQAFLNYNGEVI